MPSTLRFLVPTLAALGLAAGSPARALEPVAYAEALGDPGRPAVDRARDGQRQPEAVLEFLDARPGQRVLDYAAGTGYFTRLLAVAVGPTGHVYAAVPSPLAAFKGAMAGLADLQAYATTHPNVSVVFAAPLAAARAPEALDAVFVSQFYHDLHNRFMGPLDVAAFNRAVFAELKPGGVFVVLDHAAAPGSPPTVTDTLHRIEPGAVRREVEAAGFVFAGESRALANPADPRTKDPFDASIRGRTDQFLMKFQKPVAGAAVAAVVALPSR